MKTCEALAKAGAEVELVVPRRPGTSSADPYAHYMVESLFKITYLPTFEFTWRGRSYGFALQTLAFTFSLARYLKRHEDGSLLYMRGELGWLLPLISRKRFIWENHIRPRTRAQEVRALSRADGTVVVTKRYREDLLKEYGLSPKDVLVAPDGVDLSAFSEPLGKIEARRKLGLPLEKKLALYTGSDLSWKGLRYLREAASLLPEGYEVVFVGAINPGAALKNQRFAGVRPYAEIPLWLAAADALVLTGDPSSETALHYTSPMKLFEYMAARRPIVASDLPSFRDILSDETALLVVPGDPQALADGIVRACGEDGQGALVAAAWEAVQTYSWERRAEHLIAFIERSRGNI